MPDLAAVPDELAVAAALPPTGGKSFEIVEEEVPPPMSHLRLEIEGRDEQPLKRFARSADYEVWIMASYSAATQPPNSYSLQKYRRVVLNIRPAQPGSLRALDRLVADFNRGMERVEKAASRVPLRKRIAKWIGG